jgi:rare lipoprotein A
MRIPVPAIALISAVLSINACSVAAQSFEDRWSIIPKAHAEEPRDTDQRTSPAPPAQSPRETTAPQPQTDAAKPTGDAHDGSAIGTSRRSFLGKASFYSYHSGKTASGSVFDREARTAAHRHLPFGTKLRVTNVANDKSVVVTITDRGPHKRGRVLDLSLNAARTLGIIDRGVAEIRAEVL